VESCVDAVNSLKRASVDALDGGVSDAEADAIMCANARKLYSFYKGVVNLSDECIAGLLGNFEVECAIDPTAIEGIYDEPYTMTGPKKSKIANDPKGLSDWTIELLTAPWGYHGTLTPEGKVEGAYLSSGEHVIASAYGPAPDDGLFYPGIGIGSWTGYEQVRKVTGIAATLGVDWWDLDYQIAATYVITGMDSGPELMEDYIDYYNKSAVGSPEACADWFLANWEGCPGGPGQAERMSRARAWYERMHSENWSVDASYANEVLALAQKIDSSAIGSVVASREQTDCKEARNFDSSTIVQALVAYSYSQRRTFAEGCPGTKLYREVYDAVAPGDGYFRSCDRSVACAIRWSGADANFCLGGCSNQDAYAAEHPEAWKRVCDFQATSTGAAGAEEAKRAGLQPGDVLFSRDGNFHTLAYVGTEAAKDAYAKWIRGTDGDVGEPEDGSAWVSGSIGSDGAPSTWDTGPGSGRAPAIGLGQDATSHVYSVYRYIGNYPDKDTFASVGKSVRL
jgi:hypothetical protein